MRIRNPDWFPKPYKEFEGSYIGVKLTPFIELDAFNHVNGGTRNQWVLA